ncbi:hypothetical protein ACUNEL_03970 [Serratia sp. IR-2025]
MDNKLSELSKPVAYKFDHGVMGPGDFKYGTPQMHSTAKDENAGPLYSQEYVSALLADLEAKDERIGELESIATEYADKFQKAQDANKHLIIMSNDDKKRIAELEAKLATPVRLPDIRSDDYHETGWFQHMKYYRDVERSIRAAGFAVGDE